MDPSQHPLKLSLFDLDNTLLDGDSDYGWAQFLIEAGVLDRAAYEDRNAGFFADYKAGKLDILAFLDFQLKPLAQHAPEQLLAWRERYVRDHVAAMIVPAGRAEVAQRLADGHLVAIVTATNSFITRPIAGLLGVGNLVATEPEILHGRFTGRVAGTPCFREGKVTRVAEWLAGLGLALGDFAESWFFSDSRNDLPLLLAVDRAVAVDPDPTLAAEALARGWPTVRWGRASSP